MSIVYFHSDLDGRCAAAIVLKKYPDCRMREINYKDDPDFAEEVIGENIVFIVDFSFKPDKLVDLFEFVTPKDVIWIDHHKTAKDYEYYNDDHNILISGLRDFSEPGLSGCELTWKYFFSEEPMPEAVRLLGDYDTWRFDTKDDSMAFQFGLRSMENKPEDSIWDSLLKQDEAILKFIRQKGYTILQYKDKVSREILKNAYHVLFEKYNCLVVNTPMIDSNMFDDCGPEVTNVYDFYVTWIFTGEKHIVSLRSRGEVDVSVIAKKYGGGGHAGAAGFVCSELPWEG